MGIGIYTLFLLLLCVSSTYSSCLPCPMFTQPSYTASIPENATIGTIALTVLAFNAYSDPISYGTSYLGLNLPFEIDSSTGEIRVINQLDFESKNSYDIIVQANVYGYSKSVIATINILDSPELLQPVICTPSELLVTVYEITLTPYNSTVCLNCTSSSNDPFIYVISENNTIFIDPLGFVIITSEFDYENQTIYELTITFTDLDKTPLEGYLNMTLLILPVNEFYPYFTQDTFIYTLSELSSIGSYIGQLTAVDDDKGMDGEVIFSLINDDNESNYITITSTGQLYTLRQFDYEEASIFEFIVKVSDIPWNNSAIPFSNTTTVFIHVTDENDNPPIFTHDVYYAQVMENTSIGDYILTIQCNDADSSTFSATSVYSIIEDSGKHYFSLNSSTGVISLQSELDYENHTSHNLLVLCEDYTEPTYTSTAIVIIEVSSVNEYNCTFDQSEYIFHTLEDTPIGTIIDYVHATDYDTGLAGKLSYHSNDPFCSNIIHINEYTGAISLISNLDYESQQNYTCMVHVNDGQSPVTSDTCSVMLLIGNINDNEPSCSSIETPIEVYTNTSIGSTLVHLSCNDKDGDILTITASTDHLIPMISGDDDISLILNKPFAINGYQQIDLTITDGHFTIILPISLFVILPPFFLDTNYTCTVYEDTVIGTVICSVNSFYATHYDLNPQQERTFTILKSTGDIVLSKKLDYEVTSNYSLIVTSYNRELYESVVVNILVRDSNDNPPVIDTHNNIISVKENIPLGHYVTTINCNDQDSEENGQVSFNITSIYSDNNTLINDSPLFLIDTNTGSIVVNDQIDFETSENFRIIVECFDHGITSLTSTSIVFVNIEEENEYRPIFTLPSQFEDLSLTLSSRTQIGYELYTFKAEDHDSGTSGQICYSLTSNGEYNFINVNSNTGQLITVLPVTCEFGEIFEYLLIATDRGQPSYTTNISLSLYITDCNCYSEPSLYYVSIGEDTIPGTMVMTVNCTGNITLSPSSQDLFQIDNITKALITTDYLDYESKTNHQLFVYCTCSSFSYELTIHVSLKPVNDHTPFFLTINNNVTISEDSLPGLRVTTVQAIDEDKGRDGQVNYFIHNSMRHFQIDKFTGDIYLVDYLDREEQDYYTLNVVAIDNPINSNNSKSGQLTLHVHVSDVNDNTPQCSENVYRTSLSLYTSVGSFVVQLECHDADIYENGRIVYFMNNSSLFDINSTNGQVYLLQSITHELSLIHTIPITVQDSALINPLHTVVYLSIDFTTTSSTGGGEESTDRTRLNEEGFKNSVAIVINNLNMNQWDNEIEELLKTAVANSTSTHCNLHPSHCSLLSMCINKTSETWQNECMEYLKFTHSNVIVHQPPIITNTSTTIEVNIYVLLPMTALKAPFRQTDYVVPQETLKIIIQNNENTINALMRDIANQKPISLITEIWKELALSLLGIFMALFTAVCLAVTITYSHKSYKRRKAQTKVFIFKPERQNSFSKPERQENFSINNNVIPPKPSSSSSSYHDGCSLINISEVGGSSAGESTTTSGRTSQAGLTSNLDSDYLYIQNEIQRLNSLRSHGDDVSVDFHHPFANKAEIT